MQDPGGIRDPKTLYLFYISEKLCSPGILPQPSSGWGKATQKLTDITFVQTEAGRAPQNSVLMNRIHSIRSRYAACWGWLAGQRLSMTRPWWLQPEKADTAKNF